MSSDIFTKRGIVPPWEPDGEVAREQGFRRYEGATFAERRATLAAIDPAFGSDDPPPPPSGSEIDRQRDLFFFGTKAKPKDALRAWRSFLRMALAVDGWAMPRHAALPEAGDPWTQLRPDVPVGGHHERHTHGKLRAKASEKEEAAPRTRHEASVCDLAPRPGDPGYPHPAAIEHEDGAYLPTGHLHPLTGRPVVPTRRAHEHWHHNKYLYTPGGTAKRLGAHPRNLVRGFVGDPFVVVLEGTLKMTAVTEAGYACIDAGSVTLWSAEYEEEGFETDGGEETFWSGWVHELRTFAERHLRDRTVVVVADSDWYANYQVRRQTEKVAAILDPLVARAVACAPAEGKSYDWKHPITGVEMRKKRGIDDALGQHAPPDRHEAFLDEVGFWEQVREATLTPEDSRLSGFRADGRDTTVALLKAMGKLAVPGTDVAPYAEKQLMADIGRAKKTTREALDRAERTGLAWTVIEAERLPRDAGGYYTEPRQVCLDHGALPAWEWRTLRSWL